MSKTNGKGWRYQCKSCGYQVGIEVAFPKECPRCHAPGWWGHLVTPDNSHNGVKKDGSTVKTTIETVSAPIESPKQPKHPRCHPSKSRSDGELRGDGERLSGNNGQGDKKNSTKKVMPVAIILDLEGQGLGCKAIAAELQSRGLSEVSYRTVARLLAKQK